MPSLFQARVTINQSLLNSLRELPNRIQQNLRRKMQTELKLELQKDVDTLMEQGPELVTPFQFGTAKSRNFYFWLVRNNPDLSDGEHWLRRGIVEQGFDIFVSDRLRANLILIRNIQPESRYVLGPWSVIGHIRTGWPEQFEAAKELIREKAIERIQEMAREALLEALRK